MTPSEFYSEVRRSLSFTLSDRQLRRYRERLFEKQIEYSPSDVRQMVQLALLARRYRNLKYAYTKFVELKEEEHRDETQRTINV
jgi:hypothetical protein